MLGTGCGIHICTDLQSLKSSGEVEHGKINLIMGNRKASRVTKIGVYSLLINNGLNFF